MWIKFLESTIYSFRVLYYTFHFGNTNSMIFNLFCNYYIYIFFTLILLFGISYSFSQYFWDLVNDFVVLVVSRFFYVHMKSYFIRLCSPLTQVRTDFKYIFERSCKWYIIYCKHSFKPVLSWQCKLLDVVKNIDKTPSIFTPWSLLYSSLVLSLRAGWF